MRDSQLSIRTGFGTCHVLSCCYNNHVPKFATNFINLHRPSSEVCHVFIQIWEGDSYFPREFVGKDARACQEIKQASACLPPLSERARLPIYLMIYIYITTRSIYIYILQRGLPNDTICGIAERPLHPVHTSRDERTVFRRGGKRHSVCTHTGSRKSLAPPSQGNAHPPQTEKKKKWIRDRKLYFREGNIMSVLVHKDTHKPEK